MDTIIQIKNRLENRSPKLLEDTRSNYVHAAVLIPLFMENGGYKVLFTERTHKVEHHKGQISFPGGTVEKGDDSLEHTALRESYEEIGLLDKDVEVLGQIDDTYTIISHFVVHPFVGVIPYPYTFQVNHEEVESIMTVPIQIFTDKNSKHRKDFTEVDGVLFEGTAYEYDGKTIWGATAKIMEDFVRIIGGNL